MKLLLLMHHKDGYTYVDNVFIWFPELEMQM